jgi:hypothetical protein
MHPYRGLTHVISLTAVLSASLVFVPAIVAQSATDQDQPQTKPSGQIWRRGDRGAFVDFIVSEGQIDENDQINLANGITPALPGKDWPDHMASSGGNTLMNTIAIRAVISKQKSISSIRNVQRFTRRALTG